MRTGGHPRFVRADVVTHPDGGVVLTTPRGTALRIHLTHVETMNLLGACDGRTPLEQLAARHTQPGHLRDLLRRLQREGCLSDAPAEAGLTDWVRFQESTVEPSRPRNAEVTVFGAGRLARRAIELADVAGHLFARVAPGRPVEGGGEISGRPNEVALVVLDRPDHEVLSDVERRCAVTATPWSSFYFDTRRGWFGPHVMPGGGPSYTDLQARRLAAAPDPGAVRAWWAGSATRDDYLPPEHELTWMLTAFLIDVERWLAGAPAHGLWHEVEVDPVELRIIRHPVLPMPDAPPVVLPSQLSMEPSEMLVDARLGIVTGVRTMAHPPTFPPTLATATAVGCDINRVRPWNNDPVGGGTSFHGQDDARQAAIGELIERYCGNIIRPELLKRASYVDLVSAGHHAVDPDGLVLHSAAQYSAPGFPFVPLTRERSIHWVRGWSVTRQTEAWLPASLVYVNWYNTSRGASDRPANGTFFTGIAAGATRDNAIAAGLLEVIERHATMVWWLNRPPLQAVRPTAELADIWPHREPVLRAWLIYLDNEFGVPVMAGVVENREQQVLTIGFAARANPIDAALKAWAEALVLQEISADLLRPEGAFHATVASGRLPDQGLKPWRADRRYLDDYRADFRDVTSLICQSQVYLDPRALTRIRSWVDVPAGRGMHELPAPAAGDLATLVGVVEGRGYEVFCADITTTDVAAAGMRVVRTLVPGLVGNFPAAFPFLGRDVIRDSAVKLGWRSRPLAEAELTVLPVPHA